MLLQCVLFKSPEQCALFQPPKPQMSSSWINSGNFKIQPSLNFVYKALHFWCELCNYYEAIANSKIVHSLIEAWGGEGISSSLGNHFCISLNTEDFFHRTMLANTAVLMLSLLVTLDAILLAEAFNTFYWWFYTHTPTHCHESISANAHAQTQQQPLTGILKKHGARCLDASMRSN